MEAGVGGSPSPAAKTGQGALSQLFLGRVNLSCKVDIREINSLNLLAVGYACSTGSRPDLGRGPPANMASEPL